MTRFLSANKCKGAAPNAFNLDILELVMHYVVMHYVVDTCSAAAENGHLGVLQWARFQGCPVGRGYVLRSCFPLSL